MRLLTIAALRSSSSSTMPRSLQARERHLHHSNSAVNDSAARGDDSIRLLPAQHGLGDLGRVGEMADPHLDNFDAGNRDPFGHALASSPATMSVEPRRDRLASRDRRRVWVVATCRNADSACTRTEIEVVVDGVERA